MSLISVKNLTFAYPGSASDVFNNVSFNIDTDWKLGLVGRNGRGKTTLLKLLLGDYKYRGSISRSQKFSYFPYDVDNKNDFTCDVLHCASPNAQDWQFLKEFSNLNMNEDDFYKPFAHLSNGQQTKALLAALFCTDNNFLLIDEPTNHLDMESRMQVSEYLNSKSGFILVSHDRAFLDGCVDHILSINRDSIDVCAGDFSTWLYNFSAEQKGKIEKNKFLRKDIDRLQKSAKQKAAWSNKKEQAINGSGIKKGFISHKSAKMMKRSKNVERNINRKIDARKNLLNNAEEVDSLTMNYETFRNDSLLSLHNLAVLYDQVAICRPINLEVKSGDIIAINGINGSGKSSLLKLIAGKDINYSGEFYSASGLKISCLPQDCSGVKGTLDDFADKHEIDKSLFLTLLRKLGFDRSMFEKKIEDFSLGQKKKVMIAKSLLEPANLYIWDEPLNYLDIYCRQQLEQVIISMRPTMLIVEHDKTFIDNVSTVNCLIERLNDAIERANYVN